jgi:hypothetical protein
VNNQFKTLDDLAVENPPAVAYFDQVRRAITRDNSVSSPEIEAKYHDPATGELTSVPPLKDVPLSHWPTIVQEALSHYKEALPSANNVVFRKPDPATMSVADRRTLLRAIENWIDYLLLDFAYQVVANPSRYNAANWCWVNSQAVDTVMSVWNLAMEDRVEAMLTTGKAALPEELADIYQLYCDVEVSATTPTGETIPASIQQPTTSSSAERSVGVPEMIQTASRTSQQGGPSTGTGSIPYAQAELTKPVAAKASQMSVQEPPHMVKPDVSMFETPSQPRVQPSPDITYDTHYQREKDVHEVRRKVTPVVPVAHTPSSYNTQTTGTSGQAAEDDGFTLKSKPVCDEFSQQGLIMVGCVDCPVCNNHREAHPWSQDFEVQRRFAQFLETKPAQSTRSAKARTLGMVPPLPTKPPLPHPSEPPPSRIPIVNRFAALGEGRYDTEAEEVRTREDDELAIIEAQLRDLQKHRREAQKRQEAKLRAADARALATGESQSIPPSQSSSSSASEMYYQPPPIPTPTKQRGIGPAPTPIPISPIKPTQQTRMEQHMPPLQPRSSMTSTDSSVQSIPPPHPRVDTATMKLLSDMKAAASRDAPKFTVNGRLDGEQWLNQWKQQMSLYDDYKEYWPRIIGNSILDNDLRTQWFQLPVNTYAWEQCEQQLLSMLPRRAIQATNWSLLSNLTQGESEDYAAYIARCRQAFIDNSNIISMDTPDQRSNEWIMKVINGLRNPSARDQLKLHFTTRNEEPLSTLLSSLHMVMANRVVANIDTAVPSASSSPGQKASEKKQSGGQGSQQKQRKGERIRYMSRSENPMNFQHYCSEHGWNASHTDNQCWKLHPELSTRNNQGQQSDSKSNSNAQGKSKQKQNNKFNQQQMTQQIVEGVMQTVHQMLSQPAAPVTQQSPQQLAQTVSQGLSQAYPPLAGLTLAQIAQQARKDPPNQYRMIRFRQPITIAAALCLATVSSSPVPTEHMVLKAIHNNGQFAPMPVVYCLTSWTQVINEEKVIMELPPQPMDIDSGCEYSVVSLQFCERYHIPIVEPSDQGEIELGDGRTVKRIGQTIPLRLTIGFLEQEDQLPVNQIELNHYQFEVMDFTQKSHPHAPYVFGKDLMRQTLQSVGSSLSGRDLIQQLVLMIPFLTGIPIREVRSNLIQFSNTTIPEIADVIKPKLEQYYRYRSITTNNINFITEDGKSSVESDPDSTRDPAWDDLAPDRIELLRKSDPEHIEQFTRMTQEVLSDPELSRLIQVNMNLDPSVPIQTPPELFNPVFTFEVREYKNHEVFRKQWPLSLSEMEIINRKMNRYRDLGYIIPSPPNCAVNVPIFLVDKREGGMAVKGDRRLVMDFRHINRVILSTDKYPTRNPYITMRELSEYTLYGEVDVHECFHQFKLDKKCQIYTAFTWGRAHYMWTRLPFGLHHAGQWVTRHNNTVFHPYCCETDNIPFGSNDAEGQKATLRYLFERANKYNIRFKCSDIKTCYTSIRILGQIIEDGTVRIDPRKLEMVDKFPVPTTPKQMRAFLGVCGYMRVFIRHYGDLVAPLTALTSPRSKFVLTDLHLEHIRILKHALKTAPWLVQYNPDKQLYIACDASRMAVGGVLYQLIDGQEGEQEELPQAGGIIAILSKVANGSMHYYSTFKMEAYGLVYCLAKFHQWILGTRTVVYSDQDSLHRLLTMERLPMSVQSYLDVLSHYHLVIRYRPGIMNVLPDHLSRVYEYNYPKIWGVRQNVKFEINPSDLVPPEITAADQDRSHMFKSMVLQYRQIRDEEKDNHILPSQVVVLDDEEDEYHDEEDQRSPSLPDTTALQDINQRWDDVEEQMDNDEQDIEPDFIEPPVEQRQSILDEIHLAYGHAGINNMYKQLLAQRIKWKNMRNDVRDYVLKCIDCLKHNLFKVGYHPTQLFDIPPLPGHHIIMDCATNLPRTDEGFTVMLNIMDRFTGFVNLFAIGTATGRNIAFCLLRWCATFGFPSIIQTDNGTEFTNSIVTEFISLMGADHRFATAYRPRTQGKIEASWRWIHNLIAKVVKGAKHQWSKTLPFVQLAVNNRVSSTVNASPFALMFGRDPQVPLSFKVDQILNFDLMNEQELVKRWTDMQRRIITEVYPAIHDMMQQRQLKTAQSIDARRRVIYPDDYQPNDVVMVINPKYTGKRGMAEHRKFDPIWEGPYVITAVDNRGNYTLQDHAGNILRRKIPPEQIKITKLNADTITSYYDVDHIVSHRGDMPGTMDYLVRWRGYDSTYDEWIQERDINDVEVINDYWKKKRPQNATLSLTHKPP